MSPSGDPLPPRPLESTGPDLRSVGEQPTTQAEGAAPPLAFAGDTRYRPLHFHARGGLGEVFVARDEELHREVALKRIQERHGADAGSRRRFLREAQLTARLEHPGVVPVHGLVQDAAGQPCYAMRFVEGQTLHEAIRRFHGKGRPGNDGGQVLELRQLLTRFIAVCDTLAYAHSRGVIHRDLKPANIMLGKFGETLVLDWGLAKPVGPEGAESVREAEDPGAAGGAADGTQMGQAMGTPAYMSPEQASGRLDQLGPASDVYGLGATLYCLLTGQAPFGGTMAEVLNKVREGAFPGPRKVCRGVSPALEAICLKAMARLPQDRYANPRALAEDLEHWLAGEPFATYREPWPQRLARWGRRHRTAVTAVGVALVVAVAAAVGGLFLWESAEQRRLLQAHDYLTNLRDSAEADEQIAQGETAAGRFASAHTLLRETCKRLDGEPLLADLLARLQARRDRAGRLEEFYRLADEVERLTFTEQFAAAQARGMEALTTLGVLEHTPWPDHLPQNELTPAQRGQLREDAYRQLLYAAGLGVLLAAGRHGSPDEEPAIRSALQVLARAEDFRPSRSGATLRLCCHIILGEWGRLRPLPPGEPTSAADYYFLGLAHMGLRTKADHPVGRLLLAGGGSLVSGLDFTTPAPTAARYLQAAARLEPQHYFTYLFLSDALKLDNQLHAAELAVNTCVALRPGYALGYQLRAAALLPQFRQAGDPRRKAELFERVLADYGTAIRLQPESFRAFTLRGHAFFARGDHRRALADIDEAIRLITRERAGGGTDPGHSADLTYHLSRLYVDRGNARTALGQTDEAVADYGEAIRLEPATAAFYANRAGAYRKKKNYPKLLADYSAIINLGPKAVRSWTDRAAVYVGLRQWDKAAADLGRAAALEPDQCILHRQYAGLLVHAGDREGYRTACRRMLERFGQTQQDNVAANIALACTQAPLPDAETAQALRLAEKAVAANRSLNWYQLALGAACYRRGQYDRAVKALNESLRLDSGSLNAFLNWPLLAMTYHHLGQEDKAREWLDKADRWYARFRTGLPEGVFWPDESWWDGVDFENLLGEARALLRRQSR